MLLAVIRTVDGAARRTEGVRPPGLSVIMDFANGDRVGDGIGERIVSNPVALYGKALYRPELRPTRSGFGNVGAT